MHATDPSRARGPAWINRARCPCRTSYGQGAGRPFVHRRRTPCARRGCAGSRPLGSAARIGIDDRVLDLGNGVRCTQERSLAITAVFTTAEGAVARRASPPGPVHRNVACRGDPLDQVQGRRISRYAQEAGRPCPARPRGSSADARPAASRAPALSLQRTLQIQRLPQVRRRLPGDRRT